MRWTGASYAHILHWDYLCLQNISWAFAVQSYIQRSNSITLNACQLPPQWRYIKPRPSASRGVICYPCFLNVVPPSSFRRPYGVSDLDVENGIFWAYPYLQYSWKPLKFFKFWVPQSEIRPDLLSVVLQPHFTPLWTINVHNKIVVTDRLTQSSFNKPARPFVSMMHNRQKEHCSGRWSKPP